MWEDTPGSLLVALSVWDTEESAAAFADAYGRLLEKKHGLPPGRGNGALTTWSANTRAFVVERRDRAMLILEGAPTAARDPLRALVWAQAPAASMLD